MKYAIQVTNGNAHIMDMQSDGTFKTIAFTAGEKDNLEACKRLVQAANSTNISYEELHG